MMFNNKDIQSAITIDEAMAYSDYMAWAAQGPAVESGNALQIVTDIKQELIDDELYEKLHIFKQLEDMYGIDVPFKVKG